MKNTQLKSIPNDLIKHLPDLEELDISKNDLTTLPISLSDSRKLTERKFKYDKDKVYSLHESDIYCVGKGKDHKAYEYGRKASVVTTLESQVIIGVESHDEHVHDSNTLKPALEAANKNRQAPIEAAVVDRGYRGCKRKVNAEVIIPGSPLKRDSEKDKERKRYLCKTRSAIEPIIGHLKHDHRLTRNWLKGSQGDAINLLLAACAWNLRKWMAIFFCFEKEECHVGLLIVIDDKGQKMVLCLYG